MLKWSSKQSTFKIQWCMTMLVYFVPSCLLRHVWPKSIKFSFLQTLQLLGTKLRAHFNCYKICREKWQNYVSKPVPKSWNRPASLFVLSRIQWLRKWMTCNGSLQEQFQHLELGNFHLFESPGEIYKCYWSREMVLEYSLVWFCGFLVVVPIRPILWRFLRNTESIL